MSEAKTGLDTKSDEWLIKKREQLMDYFTPNGRNWDKLQELLEIERELTLREDV